jgi:hypothetical protein
MLQAQSSRETNLRQACQEIGEKSSEIFPLGKPLIFGRSFFQNHPFVVFELRFRSGRRRCRPFVLSCPRIYPDLGMLFDFCGFFPFFRK